VNELFAFTPLFVVFFLFFVCAILEILKDKNHPSHIIQRYKKFIEIHKENMWWILSSSMIITWIFGEVCLRLSEEKNPIYTYYQSHRQHLIQQGKSHNKIRIGYNLLKEKMVQFSLLLGCQLKSLIKQHPKLMLKPSNSKYYNIPSPLNFFSDTGKTETISLLQMLLPPLKKSQIKTPLLSKTLLLHPFSIHPVSKSTNVLKSLWESLSSKAQLLGCVFDTPDGDSQPIFNKGKKRETSKEYDYRRKREIRKGNIRDSTEDTGRTEHNTEILRTGENIYIHIYR